MVRHQVLPPRIAEVRLAESEKAAIQARELVRQILTFARGGEPTKVAVDMVPLIRDETAFVLRDTSATAKLELANDLWHVDSDPVQFCSVLNNLLINAVQSTTGPETITVRAFNETLEDGNHERLPAGAYVVIQVIDQGCGISPEHLARVFDPYFTTKPQGNGLGLASVHAIVRRHGGSVQVSSSPGQGSTFTVRLPAAFPTVDSTATVTVPEAPTGNRRILFMDDEASVREIGRRILSMKGYDVTCCSDGDEAVLLFRSAREAGTPFAAIVLDLNVTGGMGGIESASRLLELDPEARLIVSSGYASDDAIADFRRFGFSGALPKPFTIEGMAEEVARVLEEGRTKGLNP